MPERARNAEELRHTEVCPALEEASGPEQENSRSIGARHRYFFGSTLSCGMERQGCGVPPAPLVFTFDELFTACVFFVTVNVCVITQHPWGGDDQRSI